MFIGPLQARATISTKFHKFWQISQIHVQGVSFEYTVLNIQTDKWIDHGLGDDDLIQVLVGK